MILQTVGLGREVAMGDQPLVILDDINLAINAGESVAITGPSGSGKSTLLGLLAGLDVPSRGEVWLDGQSLFRLTEEGRAALRARAVGFVFQNFQLLPGLTALENVALPLELAGRSDAMARAGHWLGLVGLDARRRHYPLQLSGGEQQRVALARAFAGEPRVLFADEPTGNLDAATGAAVIDQLFELNAEAGTTLILVTHDAVLAGRCARRIGLSGGRLA
ncbi:MAG: ABC transporter ATP-binding protein [Betaproteobacteria bacterium]|jgi:putative ABC transport system ATP-binding protein|nr:ABC transporter ATP-binding protein [Betaproteobacteria bacterium]